MNKGHIITFVTPINTVFETEKYLKENRNEFSSQSGWNNKSIGLALRAIWQARRVLPRTHVGRLVRHSAGLAEPALVFRTAPHGFGIRKT